MLLCILEVVGVGQEAAPKVPEVVVLKVLEVLMPKVLEVVLYMLEVVNGMRICAMGAGGHALYAGLYSGGRGGRAPFARGARVISYVLELRTLRAVSAGSCAAMCCVLLVHGRCVTYTGSRRLCSMRSRCRRIFTVCCHRG